MSRKYGKQTLKSIDEAKLLVGVSEMEAEVKIKNILDLLAFPSLCAVDAQCFLLRSGFYFRDLLSTAITFGSLLATRKLK